jgi:AbrB family looped-hinge helix DNA binding protein
MDAAATLTSKGQITVPKSVRDALGLEEGDTLHFHVEHDRATLTKTTDFVDLAGSIAVPATARNLAWDEVIRRTRTARATRRQ